MKERSNEEVVDAILHHMRTTKPADLARVIGVTRQNINKLKQSTAKPDTKTKIIWYLLDELEKAEQR
jgi:DNA-binding Xre family transcriptional regulator